MLPSKIDIPLTHKKQTYEIKGHYLPVTSVRTTLWVDCIGPVTRCDKTGHFPAILSSWKHRRPSQIIGPATRCDEMGYFPAILRLLEASHTIALHRTPSQVSLSKSQLCGQSATHDGMFLYFPAISIAAMAYRNT